jgi:bifunctional DNase/RNase
MKPDSRNSDTRTQPARKEGKVQRHSKVKWFLLGCLTVLLVLVAGSVFIPEGLANAVRVVANNGVTRQLKGLEGGDSYKDTLVEMDVDSVGISTISSMPVVILKDKSGKIYLPIWIGPAEANAISVAVEGVEVPRPLTPDLMCSILDRVGARVDYININDIKGSTYYATIIVTTEWQRLEIDARPSDAIAIALRVGAPIYAEKSVLDEAGILPDRETGKPTVLHLRN